MNRIVKQFSLLMPIVGALACSGSGTSTPPVDAAPGDIADDATVNDDVAPTDVPRTDATTDRPRTDVPRTDAGASCPTDAAVTGTSRAGAACANDEACGAGLNCDEGLPGGYCTAECVDNPSQDCEAAQCGGRGSTCLSYGDDGTSFCAPTCVATARTGTPGSCRAGMVCTGWWDTHEGFEPDRVGCDYFCQTDAHCPMGERCNARLGECGARAAVLTRRADGEPCDPTMKSGDPPVNMQCRGVCFAEGDGDTEGLCGSYINMAVTPDCPDTPMRVHALTRSDDNGRTDNLGICEYAECSSDRDCTAPTRCVVYDNGDEPYCGYVGEDVTPYTGGARDASTDASADVPVRDGATDAGTADAARDAGAG